MDSLEVVAEDLKHGKIALSKSQVLRKAGYLFMLRHHINYGSDILDTPDFYWDEEELERLYMRAYSIFNVARRSRVVNERLTYCMELLQLLDGSIADKHNVHLEIMIIILILIEVFFEVLHYIERNQPSSCITQLMRVTDFAFGILVLVRCFLANILPTHPETAFLLRLQTSPYSVRVILNSSLSTRKLFGIVLVKYLSNGSFATLPIVSVVKEKYVDVKPLHPDTWYGITVSETYVNELNERVSYVQLLAVKTGQVRKASMPKPTGVQ
ncbi:unnamed protein product [Soboliphyme baturini]|uniref:DUF155 domain-containing protein n=1 Tax=Soboliphyme baturini TaxID=241478 RepID=A0A183IWA3_9BILA|nr:unnamed protein product [Soboliphyme baturini]